MKNILIVLAIVFSVSAYSQDYNSAIGLRGGLVNAVTYKFKLNDWSAGEAIASFRYNGLNLIGLYTIQNDWNFEGVPLQWYYGGGGHIGFVGNTYNGRNRSNGIGNEGGVYVGVDGVIGIEHTFSEFPLNISLDYKPALNLIGYTGWQFDSFSLGIRYVID